MKILMRYPIAGFLFLWLLFGGFAQPQSLPKNLTNAIKIGDSNILSRYFSSNLELVINDNEIYYEDICSKTQAQRIVQNFFAKNKPTDFKILHEGNRGDLVYATGKLTTLSKSFNVTFLIRIKGGKKIINQFRIEENF